MGSCYQTLKKNQKKYSISLYPTNVNSLISLRSSPYENHKGKGDFMKFITCLEMNNILAKNGRNYLIEFIKSFIDLNKWKLNDISEIICELLELIYQENLALDQYFKPSIIKKILEDYNEYLFKRIKHVFKPNTQISYSYFQKNIDFAFYLLCEIIEIYQVLLSYRKWFNKKKKNTMKITPWWLESNFIVKHLPTPDTYLFLRSKFQKLNYQICENFCSSFLSLVESVKCQSN